MLSEEGITRAARAIMKFYEKLIEQGFSPDVALDMTKHAAAGIVRQTSS